MAKLSYKEKERLDKRMKYFLNLLRMERVYKAAVRAGYYTFPVQRILDETIPYDFGDRIVFFLADEDAKNSYGKYQVVDYKNNTVTARRIDTVEQVTI